MNPERNVELEVTIVRESVLAAFAEKGVLPPKEVVHWRAPMGEDFPCPWASEVISFLAFHEQGLG